MKWVYVLMDEIVDKKVFSELWVNGGVIIVCFNGMGRLEIDYVVGSCIYWIVVFFKYKWYFLIFFICLFIW